MSAVSPSCILGRMKWGVRERVFSMKPRGVLAFNTINLCLLGQFDKDSSDQLYGDLIV